MLPWLRNRKQMSAVIVKNLSKGAISESEPKKEESEDEGGLEVCAKEMLSALERKDAKALARCLKDAFLILESQPHEEYEEGDEKNDYDAQNVKAARKQ